MINSNITKALIGYTGFIGSNLVTQHHFDKLYNSKNIHEIDNQEFDLVVCAGVNAVKWLANQEPEKDLASIDRLKKCLQTIKTRHLVLISTIDIYDNPNGVTEDDLPDTNKQDFYGKHRYQLEQWLMKLLPKGSYTIMRLPGLFGEHLKKNLIYDLMHPLAKSINRALWLELQAKLTPEAITIIKQAYDEDEGTLKQKPNLSDHIKTQLITVFAQIGFSTLNFTDSRSSFQFYNLTNLWHDINSAIKNNYDILNLACEPITAQELVKYVTSKEFVNHTAKGGIKYDVHSKYAKDGKYFYFKKEVLPQIKKFTETNQ